MDDAMTPAEEIASLLDEENECEGSALIRRLASALLFANDQLNQNGQAMLKYHHADALRDVKEMP